MATQLVVFIENRPGTLTELASILDKAEVNIESILLEASIDFGACRIQVDRPREAEKALTDAGFQVKYGDVLRVRIPNEHGALADLTRKLSAADINVESIFGTAGDGTSEMILTVDDVEGARKALDL